MDQDTYNSRDTPRSAELTPTGGHEPAIRENGLRRRIVVPSCVVLDSSAGFARQSIRPQEHRGSDFDEKFDSTTLFYDAFLTDTGAQALILGPPFANLAPLLETMVISALPSGARCAYRIRNMDRHSQVWVDLPGPLDQLKIESHLGNFCITPAENLCHIFAGKRVLFTLSKNNRLEWIQDWIRYHRDVHGANALLFYDNDSTAYSSDELMSALSGISGLDRICLMTWPFKYGPQGIGDLLFWDSDFCQYGAWEHARWMFLQRALSALNVDIDELVVSSNGVGVFEATERSLTGMTRFPGVWVYGFSDRGTLVSPDTASRHRDFDHYLRPTLETVLGVIPVRRQWLNTKWAAVPKRSPKNAQWTAHRIYSWRGSYSWLSLDRTFCYRHFREINNSWKINRAQRVPFDPRRFIHDVAMTRDFLRTDWES